MAVNITGRHMDLTDELRSYIERKIPRLEKYTDRLQSVEFVLEKNRYLHRAEVRLKAGIVSITANQSDADPKRAIDLLIDKVERRLSKEIGVLNKSRKRPARRTLVAVGADSEEETAAPARRGTAASAAARRGRAGTTASVNGRTGARGRRGSAGSEVTEPVWLEKLGVRVFASAKQPARSMSVEEAAETLFFEDENFLCFVNSDSGQLSVIYRRKDGNFALLETAQA